MLPIAVLKLILLQFYWQPHLLKKNLGFENSEILKCVPESVHIFHWILRHVRKYIWIFSNPEFVLYCSWRLKTLIHLGKGSETLVTEIVCNKILTKAYKVLSVGIFLTRLTLREAIIREKKDFL